MAFETDYSDVKEGSGGILPEGEYEAVIKYAGEDTTQIGTVYINITMVIRNDIDQKYKNKYVWHKIWHRKVPSPADLACGGYSSKQINSLSKSSGLPNNKKYESLAAWCEELADKPVQIVIEHEEYKGKIQTKIKWVNESRSLPCNHVWKTESGEDTYTPAASTTFEAIETIDDGDLPF